MPTCCGEAALERFRVPIWVVSGQQGAVLQKAFAQPAHLGARVSGPVLIGVRPVVEGSDSRRQSARECPVGHDERVVTAAVQTYRHGGQRASPGEHVVADKVRAAVESTSGAVAGGLPQCCAAGNDAGHPARPEVAGQKQCAVSAQGTSR